MTTDNSTPQDWRTLFGLYRSFSRFARGLRRPILLVCAFITGIAITNTLLFWQLSVPLNLLQQEHFAALPRSLLILAVIIVANQITHFGAVAVAAWIEGRLTGRLRRALLSRCLKLSFPVVDQFARGDVLARLGHEAERLSYFLTFTTFIFLSHVVLFLVYAVMLWWIDWRLAIISLACSPAFALHQLFFGRRKQRVAQQMFRNYANLVATEHDALSALQGTASFRAEGQVRRQHRLAYEAYRHWFVKNKWLDAWIHGSVTALIYLGAVVVIYFGVAHVEQGTLGIGDFVSFLFFLGHLAVPIRGFSSFALAAREVAPTARRYQEISTLHPAVRDTPNAAPLPALAGKIEFRGVSFSFPRGSAVFKGVNFTVPAGSTVALVGRSGVGKTTLVKLLMRFYDPSAGQILLDDIDIRNVSLDSLRGAVAVVWQEPFLINDTLRANLQLARANAGDSAIIAACQAAHAWEFIAALPQALDTRIGIGGVGLSAGQKQRISLAQAHLKDAPILVLDEASSAQDSESEKWIAAALDTLRVNRTTLIIAHRFSAIRDADAVLFFNGDGSLTLASHASLWNSHPEYRSAVEWQTALHKPVSDGPRQDHERQ